MVGYTASQLVGTTVPNIMGELFTIQEESRSIKLCFTTSVIVIHIEVANCGQS